MEDVSSMNLAGFSEVCHGTLLKTMTSHVCYLMDASEQTIRVLKLFIFEGGNKRDNGYEIITINEFRISASA